MPLQVKKVQLKVKDGNQYVDGDMLFNVDAEAWARGQRNGQTITDPNDPAYNQNAYFYAQQAATSAATADQIVFTGNLAPSYSSSAAYQIGDYVMYNNALYECTTAIPSPGEAFNVSHWQAVMVSDIKEQVDNIIVINEQAQPETKIQIETTDEDVDIALMSDLTAAVSSEQVRATAAQTAQRNRALAAENLKVNRPLVNGQPNDGVDGQVLRTRGDGTTVWQAAGTPGQAQTQAAVDAWMNKNAWEYVIPDNSIDINKLQIGTLSHVTPEMFEAIGDGETDDSIALKNAMTYAKNNGFVLKLDGDYLISDLGFILDKDLIIDGANSKIITTGGKNVLRFVSNNYSLTLNEEFLSGTNIVALTNSGNCSVGDIITFTSANAIETSYNTKANFSARIVKIDNNVITLNDSCPFTFAINSTVSLHKKATLYLKNINLECRTDTYYTSITVSGLTLKANNITVDGKSDNYAFLLSDCVDSIVSNVYCYNVFYGFLVNGCNNCVFKNLFTYGTIRHITSLAKFSKNIVIDGARGNGALIESHTSIDPQYLNCNFMITNESWNLRSLGGRIQNCKIKVSDDINNQEILLQSISFIDTSIWQNCRLYIDNCDITIKGSIEIRNGYYVEITNNVFKELTTLRYGATTSSMIKDCKIENNINLFVSPSTRTALIESTNLYENVANGDKTDGSQCVIDQRIIPSYRVSNTISEYEAKGCILAHYIANSSRSITIPVTIYFDNHRLTGSHIIEILSAMKIDVITQYAYTPAFIEKVILDFEIVANPNNNFIVITNPNEIYFNNSSGSTRYLQVSISDVTLDGNSVSTIPTNHCIKFNLNITAERTGCRIFANYESKNHCLLEAY